MKEYNAIFHIDEMGKWNLILKNVSNLIDALKGETFQIEVLANAEAVRYYSNDNDNIAMDALKALYEKGVRFVACNNALMANNLKSSSIFEFVDIVPAGVLELIIKQNEGYAYIKP